MGSQNKEKSVGSRGSVKGGGVCGWKTGSADITQVITNLSGHEFPHSFKGDDVAGFWCSSEDMTWYNPHLTVECLVLSSGSGSNPSFLLMHSLGSSKC